MDTNAGFGFSPVSGRHSLYLFGSGASDQVSETISQTGLIPSTANSLQMLIGNATLFYNPPGDFDVSLNGQTISMMPIANFPTYTVYAGNVSQFANQTATLNITAAPVLSGPGPNAVLLDNIIFSPFVVPEPGALALSVFGGLLLGWRAWRKTRQGRWRKVRMNLPWDPLRRL